MQDSSEDETGGLYTPSITRNGFMYTGGKFWVEGDQHRHPREDARRLYSILTYTPPPPLLTKKGTVAARQPLPFKEPPAHFFTAQMAHYGLKPLKRKESAKKKLLAAFTSAGGDGKNFQVPTAILELENALKKEWHDADEARKAKLVANKEGSKQATAERYQGRGSYYDSDESMEDERQRRTKGSADTDSDADRRVAKADIRNEIENISIARARGLLLKLIQDPRAKKIMETEILWTRNAANRGYKEIGQRLKREEWAGKYILKCPAIKMEWGGYDHHEFSLTIYPSSTSSRLWISFDLGIISGVMRSAQGLPKEVGQKIFAEWRGREDGENAMKFGESNRAVLKFFGGGNVEGELRGFPAGKACFTGYKDKSVKTSGNVKSQVKKLKTEFRSYNWHNYEAENEARWGKWAGEEQAESAFVSDTSAGRHKRKGVLTFDSGVDSDGDESMDYSF